MLWVGWYGFNAGSAGAADGIAANAFTTTTLAAAVASFTWGALEYLSKRRASVLGFCSGVVAGLVVVTPAAGYIDTTGAVIIGLLAGFVPFVFCVKLKSLFGYDDALDTFGIHAVGGTLGAVLTGVFATPSVNPGIEGLMNGLLMEQLKAVGFTIVLSVVATAVIAFFVKATIGLRPTIEAEQEGLDLADHGEEGYIYEAKS
jgi:Amt family ammonium transporter